MTQDLASETAVSPAVRSICVFGACRPGNDPKYMNIAYELGQKIAQRQIELVYGGSNRGMMGAVAKGCHEAGGQVLGILLSMFKESDAKFAESLSEKEVVYGREILVPDFPSRLQLFHANSDAFIAMPGGLGTAAEVAEVLASADHMLHAKPLALLNAGGYFDGLLASLRRAVADGHVSGRMLDSIVVSESIDEILNCILKPSLSCHSH